MQPVAKFSAEKRAFNTVYSFVSLTPEFDISETANEQITAAGGDAIINLQVEASDCGLNKVPFLDFLPCWVGCANITTTGTIVKVAS